MRGNGEYMESDIKHYKTEVTIPTCYGDVEFCTFSDLSGNTEEFALIFNRNLILCGLHDSLSFTVKEPILWN